MAQDDTPPTPPEPQPPRALSAPRGLLRLANALLSAEAVPVDPRVREAGLRLLGRAEQVMDRLDLVAGTLQQVAELELRLVRKLGPIVDDLGELVRHNLDEVRERRGLRPLGARREPPVIIDHEPESST